MANEMRDKIAEIIRTAHINANPLAQFGYAEADALIENGVIVPPCKVGDTVYVTGVATLQILERKVIGVYFYEEGISLALVNGMVVDVEHQFGKTIFLTKEEAEQKLKEMRGGNDL